MPIAELDLKITAPSTVHVRRRWTVPISIAAILVVTAINLSLLPLSWHGKSMLTKAAVFSSEYEQRQKGPWSWWLSRAYMLHAPCDIVLMGDSQMNAAIMQADAITNRKNLDVLQDREATTLEHLLKERTQMSLKVVNLGLAGAMVSDQYLISKALFAVNPPKVIILGVSPRSFLDNAMPAASATEPFHFFQRYVKLNSLVSYLFPDVLTQANWLLQEYFPLKQLYHSCLQALDSITYIMPGPDRLANTPKSDGVPNISSKQKLAGVLERSPTALLQAIAGATDEPAKGESIICPVALHGFLDNTREYQRRYHDPSSPNYKNQDVFFREYLHFLNSIGSQVFVVGMPVLIANRKLLPKEFWNHYRKQMQDECASFGASWVDLSEDSSFSRSDFLDNVHLNADGGRLLLKRIASLISTNSQCLRILKPANLASANK